jgi:hypothetical protein
MVGVHLLTSRPAIDVLEHFLQKLHNLVGCEIVTHLPTQVLCATVLPARMHLFLQRRDSMD